MFGLSVPIPFAVCWIAINFALMVVQHTEVQAAADAGALAGAQHFSLSQQTTSNIQNAARSMARAQLHAFDFVTIPDVVTANVDLSHNNVTVSIKRTLNPVFGVYLGFHSNIVTANATASTRSSPICVRVLDPARAAVFNTFGGSNLSAPGCSNISDSTSATGMSGTTNGSIMSAKARSAGGFAGNAFSPRPVTDCPVVRKPLAGRKPPPNVNALCDYDNFTVNSSGFALNPGVYCGGISIKKGTATLNQGNYILRGGGVTTNAGSAVQGTDVGICLTGGAVLDGQPNSGVDQSAPSGANDPMSGFAFWENPNNMPAGSRAIHKIWSNNAQNLHGTVTPSRESSISAATPT